MILRANAWLSVMRPVEKLIKEGMNQQEEANKPGHARP
jgi:hypothetical protein